MQHYIIPDFISDKLGEHFIATDDHVTFRARRASTIALSSMLTAGTTSAIYDAKQHRVLPGAKVARLAQKQDKDYINVKRASDLTMRFFKDFYQRDGIDGENHLGLVHTIHYGKKYNNAFWDGTQMVYGDGDGVVFRSFTHDIDIIAHEITHGIMQYGANIGYTGEAGAINEHLSDVFGIMVKQWSLRQNALMSNWLIGELLFPDPMYALRSMAAPGTAYRNHPVLGTDPQPAHFKNFVQTKEDNGGVHINSGILNRVFYLACINGTSQEHWKTIGQIWYDFLSHHTLNTNMTFKEFKEIILEAAQNRFAMLGSQNYYAIVDAFKAVGIV
ncbi:MAG: hypothetical protein RLZZ292_878 [Bacteroidota bacterium]|jgi:Zn-dependent metalloprotease